ncbi:helix-turn-helix domain-containing protein [Terrimonas sp. NA20]|uniref:Helix-turn-helix domain-containing protein n=1 Tax=Terrimonas ginsenosidimutans TaxID=2908004 RepID=A0ABS9L0B0_9BACT|nr:helix-turn-helix domain-containing protein [Terrimonas ginsenosidimutans]MCG2618008.1 helix-turn-helix domain-containing protein [Terrimonas ginsenosidimutans]
MKFETIIPCERLRPYIRQFVISESSGEQAYQVFPGTGLVLGFQYRGSLSVIRDKEKMTLSGAGITGILDSVRSFKSHAETGTVLVYFTETGLGNFTVCPANELFDLSISLDNIFDKQKVRQAEEKLAAATTDQQRIAIMERFFLLQLKDIQQDHVIKDAVRLICANKGSVQMAALSKKLLISQSPLEKRFRKLVGASPKKFASIIRFHSVLNDLNEQKSLMDICHEHKFFDQAHFIKDFRRYTGTTPQLYQKKSQIP